MRFYLEKKSFCASRVEPFNHACLCPLNYALFLFQYFVWDLITPEEHAKKAGIDLKNHEGREKIEQLYCQNLKTFLFKVLRLLFHGDEKIDGTRKIQIKSRMSSRNGSGQRILI